MTFMGFQGYSDRIGFVTELFRQFLHGFTCLCADFMIVFSARETVDTDIFNFSAMSLMVIGFCVIYLGLEGYALVCNFGYAIRAWYTFMSISVNTRFTVEMSLNVKSALANRPS